MKKKLRRSSIFFGIFLFVFFSGISLWWLGNHSRVENYIKQIVLETAGKELNGKLEIDQLYITFPPAVKLGGIRFTGEDDKRVTEIPQVRISLNYWNLLRGQFDARAIDQVALQSPKFFIVESEPGKWNLSNLVKQDTGTVSSKYQLSFLIQNAQVYVNRQNLVEKEIGLNGKIDVNSDGKIVGGGDFLLEKDRGQVTISWHQDTGNIKVSGKELDLSHSAIGWLPNQEPRITDWKGRLKNYEFKLERTKDLKWQIEGKGSLSEAGLVWQEYVLSGWNGSFSTTEQELQLTDFKGNLNGELLSISGRIGLSGENKLDVKVQTEKFQVSVIPFIKNQGLSGILSGEAQVTGTIDNPIFTGKIGATNIIYQESEIGSFISEITGNLKEIKIVNFAGQFFDGQMTGDGQFNIEKQTGDAKLALQNISLTQISEKLKLTEMEPLSGRVSGTIMVNGGIQAIQGNGDLHFVEGQVKGVLVSKAKGTFSWAAGNSYSVDLDLLAAGGTLKILSTPSVIRFSADQIEMKYFQHFIPTYPVSGTISGQGNLEKVMGDWQGEVEFSGKNGFLVSQPFDSIVGKLVIRDQGRAYIENMTMIQYGGEGHQFGWLDFKKVGEHFIAYPSKSLFSVNDHILSSFKSSQRSHQINGWVLLDGSDSMLEVKSDNFRGETILPFLPIDIFVSGNMTNQMIIRGNLHDPIIEGTIRVNDGSAGLSKEKTVLIDRISGEYHRKNGIWTLGSFRFENWGMNFSANGWFDEQGDYELIVSEGQIFTERPFLWDWPYPVSGLAHFGGVIKGRKEKYTIDAQLAAPLIQINGQSLENVNLIVTGDQLELRIPEFSFTQGEEGQTLFKGYANGPKRTIYGEIEAKKLKLSQTLPLITIEIPELEGILSGNINITLSPGHIETEIKGFISNGTFRNQTFDQVNFHVQQKNKAWEIYKLTGKIGTEGFIAAEGGVDSEGNLNIQIGGRDVEASLLPDLTYSDVPLTGKLQLVAQATGNVANPEVALSGNITPGSIGGVSFDNFQTLMVLKDKNIWIEQMSLTKGIYQASLDGKIPLAALMKEEIGREESMDLNVRLDNANLAILPMINSVIRQADGVTTGQLRIKGSLAHPNIVGAIGIQNGIIYFDKMKNPLENIQLEIDFKGDSFVISQGSAKMGKGSLTVSGQGALAGTTLTDYRASIVAQRMEINSPYYKGAINGQLELLSGVTKPKLQGNIDLERVTVTVPITLLVQDSQAFYFPETDLDIQLRIGEKVRFYDPVFYDFSPQGNLRIRRTIQKPALVGHLEVNSGRIWYFGNQFDLLEGKANFEGFTGLIPEVSLSAQTRMVNTVINLNAKGPATQMEFVLSSEPSMSQEEIRNLLLFKTDQINVNSPEFGQQLSSAGALAILEMGLQTQGLFGLQKFAQENFGVDELALTQIHFANQQNSEGFRNQFEANYGIRIGKSLGKNFFISNTVSFNDIANGVTNLRYDFNRYWNISLDWERDDEKNRYRIFLRGRF